MNATHTYPERFRRLAAVVILPGPLLQIRVGFAGIDGKTVCRLDVTPDGKSCHLDGEGFVRSGNRTVLLKGPDLTHWNRTLPTDSEETETRRTSKTDSSCGMTARRRRFVLQDDEPAGKRVRRKYPKRRFKMIANCGPSANRNSFVRHVGVSRDLPTDWDVIQRCKERSRNAWNTLIARHEKSIYKFAYTLSHNYDDAADIAGQVFVPFYDDIHTFRNESHFTSWLFCIVRNVYVDTCVRTPHRSHISLDDGMEFKGDRLIRDIVDPAPTPEAPSIEKERQNGLSKAIRHLPEY